MRFWLTLKGLGEAIAQAQGINRANHLILMEIVRDPARGHPYPQKYLADVFERISARGDLRPIERELHPPTIEFRHAISEFFALAGQNLNKPG